MKAERNYQYMITGETGEKTDVVFPSTYMEISLSSVNNNIQVIKEHIGEEVGIIAIIKSDGYGHGLIPMAEEVFAQGVAKVGVNDASEVRRLREHNIDGNIVCLYSPLERDIPSLVSHDAEITIDRVEQVEQIALCGRDQGKTTKLHIEVETGMNRYGVMPKNVVPLIEKLQQIDHVLLEGLFIHFATSYDDAAFVTEQTNRFIDLLKTLASHNIDIPTIHLANGGAISQYLPTYSPTIFGAIMPRSKIMVRPGGIIYGSGREQFPHLPLQSAITEIVSHITHTKKVNAHESIGYGRNKFVEKDTHIGVAPVGWGNANYVLRNGEVLLRGKRVKILGYVSSAAMQIESTEHVYVGEEILLAGKSGEEEISLTKLAQENGFILNQLIALLSARIPRVYYTE